MTSFQIHQAILIVCLAVVMAMTWWRVPPSPIRRSMLLVQGGLLLGGVFAEGRVLYASYAVGCLGAAAFVPYHEGMTLCPGQTAYMAGGATGNGWAIPTDRPPQRHHATQCSDGRRVWPPRADGACWAADADTY